MTDELLLTLKQVADELHLPESTVRYYRDAFLDHIPSIGTGRRRRYPPAPPAPPRQAALAPPPPPPRPAEPGMSASEMERLRAELESERALVERLREAKLKLEHRASDAEARLEEQRPRKRTSVLSRLLKPGEA